MPHDEPKDDPQLGNKRNQLITQSDLGRIAAKYYLKYQTMEIFSTYLGSLFTA